MNILIQIFFIDRLHSDILQTCWLWGALALNILYCDGFKKNFSKNSPNLANRLEPNFPESFFVCDGQEGRKTPKKSENSGKWVQSSGHNSEANPELSTGHFS